MVTRKQLKQSVYSQVAKLVSTLSTCQRLQVGAVLVRKSDGNIVAIGFNGNAKGLSNTCDSDVPGQCQCLHAELNALLKISPGEICSLFISHMPCVMCAKAIINHGSIHEVYYNKDYRLTDGIMLLVNSNILCSQL